MGVREWLTGRPQGPAATTIGLDDLLERYDIEAVDRDNGVIVVKELAETATEAVSKGEIGGTSTTRYRQAILGDYNPKLSGVNAIETYREMQNDAVVRSSLRIAKTPIISARWFMSPASQDAADLEVADFVWKNLTQWMSTSWPQFLIETLYMLDYGVWVVEKVFDFRVVNGERRVVWKKFAPRPPYEILEFEYDDQGGPRNIVIQTDDADVPLPIWKALVFTYDKEAGNLWGKSLLRSAYKHFYYREALYQIDAIQKERHGIGIPIVKLPPNFSKDDKIQAGIIGSNLRTNESAHVVLPPGWEIFFLKLEGQKVDALESAQHHADKLYENVLAAFLFDTGASGSVEAKQQVFVRAVRFTAEILRDVLNHYAIPQLVDYNWTVGEGNGPTGYPQLRARRLGDERDWRTLSFALRNLIGAGVLRTDDRLEEWAREELDLPAVDIDTLRNVSTPQLPSTGGTPRPPLVGPPRQSPAQRQQIGPSTRGVQDVGGSR